MYQKKEKGILMTVVKNKQVAALKEEVHQIDPQAFVIIGNASEVCGNGFHSFTEQA